MDSVRRVNEIINAVQKRPRSKSTAEVFLEYRKNMENFYKLLYETLYEFDWYFKSSSRVLNCSIEIYRESYILFFGGYKIRLLSTENIKVDGSVFQSIEIIILGSVKKPIFIQKFHYDSVETENVIGVIDDCNFKFYKSTYELWSALCVIQYKIEGGES